MLFFVSLFYFFCLINRPDKKELILQTSYRVSDNLRKFCKDIEWEWAFEPTDIILKGGIARVKILNSEKYDFAEIIFDSLKRIKINLISVNALESEITEENNISNIDSEITEIKPDIGKWYENICNRELTNLMTQLNAKGIKSIIIKLNGEVTNTKKTPVLRFDNFPNIKDFLTLEKLIKDDGIKTEVFNNELILNW